MKGAKMAAFLAGFPISALFNSVNTEEVIIMNENHNIKNYQWQDTAKDIAIFSGGIIATAITVLIAQKQGLVNIQFGKQPPSPFEQLKTPAAALALSIIKEIDPKDVIKFVGKIVPK